MSSLIFNNKCNLDTATYVIPKSVLYLWSRTGQSLNNFTTCPIINKTYRQNLNQFCESLYNQHFNSLNEWTAKYYSKNGNSYEKTKGNGKEQFIPDFGLQFGEESILYVYQ